MRTSRSIMSPRWRKYVYGAAAGLPLAVLLGLGIGDNCFKTKKIDRFKEPRALELTEPPQSRKATLPPHIRLSKPSEKIESLPKEVLLKHQRTEPQPTAEPPKIVPPSDNLSYRFEDVELVVPSSDVLVEPHRTIKCREVWVEDAPQGYIRSWLPGGIVDRVQQGDKFYNLFDVFPAPQLNIYHDIVDLGSGQVMGKKAYLHLGPGLLNFVWNNGVEEFYVADAKQGDVRFLYRTDRQVSEVSSKPVWWIEFDDASMAREPGNYAPEHVISPLADPETKYLLGSHEDGYNYYIRLQDSCAKEAPMRPRFLEITVDNFPSFVESVYLDAGWE